MFTAHYCVNCMTLKTTAQPVCRVCGFDERRYFINPEYLPPGSKLDQKYVIGKVLGRGGFGITYLALDATLGRKVAIKEYFASSMAYRDYRKTTCISITTTSPEEQKVYTGNYQKFIQEARILAQFGSIPGIVRVHDLFEKNGTAYFVMEYLSGKHLRKYVYERGRLSWKDCADILLPVMKSLQLLHQRGIIHRDISPDNLVFHGDGRIRLVDFGGARFISSKQKTSFVLVKKGFSPYELMAGTTAQGPWTDTYSMAAVLYYCLCGHSPIGTEIGVDGRDLVSQIGSEISLTGKQKEVLAKGLSREPEKRFLTMTAFAEAIMFAR